MHALLLVVLSAALCASSHSQQESIETLMDNVLVLSIPHAKTGSVPVPLTCGEGYENQPVFWKKNGKEFDDALKGNQVTVDVEEMDGGNFTCHLGPDGTYLNHTLILVRLKPDNTTALLEESPEEGHIRCSASNYKGSFHCKWTTSVKKGFSSNAVVLQVKAARHLETIPCELDADGSGVHCQDSNCGYTEEQRHITLTVYIYSNSWLEVYTKLFYLREIVRPAKLPNLDRVGHVFSWNYPDSWEKPCTYFSLQFQVKAVRRGETCNSDKHILLNITGETNYTPTVKTPKYVFCVRAQDKHTNGLWSDWSQCNVNKEEVIC